MLAWGFIEYGPGYGSVGQDDDLLRTLRWFTDFIVACHSAPNELYVQVGDVNVDHNYWGRPEDMTMLRPAYKVNSSYPGTCAVT